MLYGFISIADAHTHKHTSAYEVRTVKRSTSLKFVVWFPRFLLLWIDILRTYRHIMPHTVKYCININYITRTQMCAIVSIKYVSLSSMVRTHWICNLYRLKIGGIGATTKPTGKKRDRKRRFEALLLQIFPFNSNTAECVCVSILIRLWLINRFNGQTNESKSNENYSKLSYCTIDFFVVESFNWLYVWMAFCRYLVFRL